MRIAQILRGLARGGREILARARIENRARRADHEARPRRRLARRHHLRHIATLRADTRHQERQIADARADIRELFRIRGADHQHAVVSRVPFLRHLLGDVLEQLLAAHVQILKILRARIARAAKNDDALVAVLEERLDRIAAEIRIHRHRIRVVALERLVRVLLGRAADVAALRIQDHDRIRAGRLDVVDGVLELILRRVRRVVRELRLVRAHQIARGIDDGAG